MFTALQVLALSSVGFSTILPVVGPKHYDVAITTFALNDPSRLDPFAKDNRTRSIMASAYYPASNCGTKKSELYMPPATALFQNEKFAAYGLPDGSFSGLELETCANPTQSKSCNASQFPLVLFSGALATSRLLYSSMLQSIAAAGYIVVSLDHPYDTDFVEFPNGTNITSIDISSDADIALALTTRVNDISFLYTQLTNPSSTIIPGLPQTPKTAVFGHSLGGAAAAAAIMQLPYLRGALNIDGSMFGPVLSTGTSKPFMLLGHENKTQATDPSWAAIWPNLSGWKAEYEVKGAAHYSFSDLPLITKTLGLQEMLPKEVGEVLGTVEGERMQGVSVELTAAFLEMVGKGRGERAVKKAVREFGEVKKVA
ncbi:PAF acetylhydrolase family protein [Plenodomus tracheiphilus IPT5]|uniref:1-alkyl-2-acetylglycerophosphocholine esterase n=1 Tax=Plenodomus tracheiphilus IPT5 TaxID=1408161 RepID=A0A6A7BDD5_9PLEO|nr:PAF acetylhydrolase family protein [Plenodomus tracheiphilus IPT5]